MLVVRKSIADYVQRRWGAPALRKSESRREAFLRIKGELLAHIRELQKKEAAELKKAIWSLEKSFYLEKATGKKREKANDGAIRTWSNGKKYKRIAPGKWVQVFNDDRTRGAQQSLRYIEKKIASINDELELMKFVQNNKEKFVDNWGYPLPAVERLSQLAHKRNDEIVAGKEAEAKEKKKQAAEHKKERDERTKRAIKHLAAESGIDPKDYIRNIATEYGRRGRIAREIMQDEYGEDMSMKTQKKKQAEEEARKRYEWENRDMQGYFYQGSKSYDYTWVRRNKRYNIVNRKGEPILDEWVDNIDEFEGDFAVVENNGKKNLFDRAKGAFVLNDWHTDVSFDKDVNLIRFNDGLWGDGVEGFYDKDGKLLFSVKGFINPHKFENGVARVFSGTKRNIVDTKGHLVSDEWFDFVTDKPFSKQDVFDNPDGNGRFAMVYNYKDDAERESGGFNPRREMYLDREGNLYDWKKKRIKKPLEKSNPRYDEQRQ